MADAVEEVLRAPPVASCSPCSVLACLLGPAQPVRSCPTCWVLPNLFGLAQPVWSCPTSRVLPTLSRPARHVVSCASPCHIVRTQQGRDTQSRHDASRKQDSGSLPNRGLFSPERTFLRGVPTYPRPKTRSALSYLPTYLKAKTRNFVTISFVMLISYRRSKVERSEL